MIILVLCLLYIVAAPTAIWNLLVNVQVFLNKLKKYFVPIAEKNMFIDLQMYLYYKSHTILYVFITHN